MKIAVILPAAGLGKRFAADDSKSPGGDVGTGSKIEADLAGRPVFLRAIELFLHRPAVVQIILALRPQSLEEFKFRWGDKLAFHHVELVAGGQAERWETVWRALQAVTPEATHVAVHDAARPLTSAALINRVFEAASTHGAVIPGCPVSATLKRVAAEEAADQAADPLDTILGGVGKTPNPVRRVMQTIDRRELVEVQTPQVFEAALLRRAYARLLESGVDKAITDDAGVVEALGETVWAVEGESTNLKITRPGDLALAQAFVQAHQAQQAASLGRKRLFKDEDD